MRPIHMVFLGLSIALFVSNSLAAPVSDPAMPTGNDLTAAIAAADSGLFDAYNHCDLDTFASYVAPDLEFYHDKTGLTRGRDKLVESVKDAICGKLRRELTAGSLEVYPIKNFGAVEIGSHRFCELKAGNCDAVARFILLWKYSDGKWSLSRVISYDHHIAP